MTATEKGLEQVKQKKQLQDKAVFLCLSKLHIDNHKNWVFYLSGPQPPRHGPYRDTKKEYIHPFSIPLSGFKQGFLLLFFIIGNSRYIVRY